MRTNFSILEICGEKKGQSPFKQPRIHGRFSPVLLGKGSNNTEGLLACCWARAITRLYSDQRTDRPTDRPTDRRTNQPIECFPPLSRPLLAFGQYEVLVWQILILYLDSKTCRNVEPNSVPKRKRMFLASISVLNIPYFLVFLRPLVTSPRRTRATIQIFFYVSSSNGGINRRTMFLISSSPQNSYETNCFHFQRASKLFSEHRLKIVLSGLKTFWKILNLLKRRLLYWL